MTSGDTVLSRPPRASSYNVSIILELPMQTRSNAQRPITGGKIDHPNDWQSARQSSVLLAADPKSGLPSE